MELLAAIQKAFFYFLAWLSNNNNVYSVVHKETQLRIEARRIS